MDELRVKHEGLEVLFYRDGSSLRQLGIFPWKIAEELRANPPTTDSLACCVETEFHCTGEDLDSHHGTRLVGGNPGLRLVFSGMVETADGPDRLVTLNYTDPVLGLEVGSHYKLVKGLPVIRRWVSVRNGGSEAVGLEHLFSCVVNGLGMGGEQDWSEKMRLHLAHSAWCSEGQWRSGPVGDFGLHRHNPGPYGMSCISVSQIGSCSSAGYMPMAVLEDCEAGVVWFWQIEHNGSWHWEIGRLPQGSLYLSIGGPNEEHGHWWKNLRPGEEFETVPVAIGVAEGDWQDAIAHLTSYRRTACMKPHPDNRLLPVIFDDFFSCLPAGPTTEKELPLIEAASKIGAEIFLMDAGWYAAPGEDWWPTVGEWQPNPERFPRGLSELTNSIRAHGMLPGIWVEIESVGVKGPVAAKPDSWFMMRHGKRVIDCGRYLLDFRNPEVRAHADEVMDRLVNDYGFGYLKFDFNITARMGTETNADSFGDGLLQHNRAFLGWLDNLARRHPSLTIESCAAGGMRMDYAMLSRCQVQSASDQSDYRYWPPILSGTIAGATPEQLGIWSLGSGDADEEQIAFQMINAMLCRIYLLAHILEIPPERLRYIKEAISTYKTYRREIPQMTPFWPTGQITLSDRANWHTLGLMHNSKPEALLAVWRLEGPDSPDTFAIPVPQFEGKQAKAELIYPKDLPCRFGFDQASATLSVELEKSFSARLFKLRY